MCQLICVAQGSSIRSASNNTLRPDLQSLGMSMQQSMLTSAHDTHPMLPVCHSHSMLASTMSTRATLPVSHASGSAVSTTASGPYWSGPSGGYSFAGKLPTSRHSWMSQASTGHCSEPTRCSIAEGVLRLPGPTTVNFIIRFRFYICIDYSMLRLSFAFLIMCFFCC